MNEELWNAISGARVSERIEHSNGVVEERCADGSMDFRGPFEGEGTLSILSTGAATINWPSRLKDERVRMLQTVAENLPQRPIEIADINFFKGEAQMLLEALRKQDAQFFRDIGDALKPRPSAAKTAKDNERKRLKNDDLVWQSILIPAQEAGGVPSFKSMLEYYRQFREFRSETATQFKNKLLRRHFSWIYKCYPT